LKKQLGVAASLIAAALVLTGCAQIGEAIRPEGGQANLSLYSATSGLEAFQISMRMLLANDPLGDWYEDQFNDLETGSVGVILDGASQFPSGCSAWWYNSKQEMVDGILPNADGFFWTPHHYVWEFPSGPAVIMLADNLSDACVLGFTDALGLSPQRAFEFWEVVEGLQGYSKKSDVCHYIAVPELEGYTRSDAGTLIESLNLAVGSVTWAGHGRWQEGVVIGTSPVSSSCITPGTEVNLILSNGTVDVPDIRGMGVLEARDVLTDFPVSYTVSVEIENAASCLGTPGNVVVDQSIPPEPAPQGQHIVLYVECVETADDLVTEYTLEDEKQDKQNLLDEWLSNVTLSSEANFREDTGLLNPCPEDYCGFMEELVATFPSFPAELGNNCTAGVRIAEEGSGRNMNLWGEPIRGFGTLSRGLESLNGRVYVQGVPKPGVVLTSNEFRVSCNTAIGILEGKITFETILTSG
jgi:hypothetical protein